MPVRKPAVRVAFAGAGKHLARSHAVHLHRNPDASIIGVFDPSDVSVGELKEELGAAVRFKRYGRPLELSLDFTYHKPDPDRAGLHGGSMLQDHMNHEFDYLCFLFGMQECTAHKLLDEADRYHVAGVRKDGIAFSFGGTRRLDNKSYGEVIAVRFERATVHIDTYRSANSYVHDHETPKHSLRPIGAGVTNYDARFKAVNNNWIDAICGKGANYLSAEGMLANSFMSVAFAQSSTVHFRS